MNITYNDIRSMSVIEYIERNVVISNSSLFLLETIVLVIGPGYFLIYFINPVIMYNQSNTKHLSLHNDIVFQITTIVQKTLAYTEIAQTI